jgi:hypothetical protein
VSSLGKAVREELERALRARLGGEGGGDLCNSGAALSEEALSSFLDAVKESRALRRIVLEVEDIPGELRSRWFYGSAPLELVVTFHAGGRPAEMFRRAGRAAFKGMGEVTVWELAADSDGPAALLRHFGKSWFGGEGGGARLYVAKRAEPGLGVDPEEVVGVGAGPRAVRDVDGEGLLGRGIEVPGDVWCL